MVQVINTVDKPDVERLEAEAVNKAENRSLYAARIKIHPKAAEGFFRTLKWRLTALFLAVYYITPWLRWSRGAHAPDQAVLIDLANRRFYFFFIEIWPQEFYYVAGLLIMGGIGLFFITSLTGRAWCGYACWQTVWTDLFIAVERFVEGDRNARIKLDAEPWSIAKLGKRGLKMFVWALIALATGGAWVFYFADAPTLLKQLVTGQAESVAYLTIAILAALTFTFAGFMREQVCTYMCPWPRIQGAMLDEHSLTVTYNAWRGEPRSLHRKKMLAKGEPVGDCVDCNSCVAVCPMGIDIRDGNQLECINCALCIDACDQVMDKIGLPKGLISYSTVSLLAAKKVDKSATWPVRNMIRPRTIVYFSLWALVGLGMLVSLTLRDRLGVNIVADRNPLYVKLSDGAIRNGYTVKILNMKAEPRSFHITIENLPGAALEMVGEEGTQAAGLDVDVEPDKVRAIKVYVSTLDQKVIAEEATHFTFKVEEKGSGEDRETSTYDAIFHAPDE
jgi:cytochrome c oxidase accessory protein FixG